MIHLGERVLRMEPGQSMVAALDELANLAASLGVCLNTPDPTAGDVVFVRDAIATVARQLDDAGDDDMMVRFLAGGMDLEQVRTVIAAINQ